MTALPTAPVEPVRLAFLGRCSTADQQDPTLSIPRQYNSSARQAALLPFPAEIVVYFWDVESGRKELDERGYSTLHQQLAVPVPRDGGVADLLAEALSPARRFDAVICESVDRAARTTYFGTKIEHDLERVGVPLWSAEEPITLGRKNPNQVLMRRMKQGISEWYVLNILEQSWRGTCEHVRQGWNIGPVPYGYRGEKVPHPVPAKRADGLTKTRLILDPERAEVVRRIFDLRVLERLGCRAIAARLNADLERNPPPNDHGAWSVSTVRSVLRNAKYTGHMVYNRRGRKTAHDKLKPRSEWVWSPEPTHPTLVSRETWEAAQEVADGVERSRADAGPNLAHPQAARTYPLRSYVVCAHCARRMSGKVKNRIPYMHCRPIGAAVPGVTVERFRDHPRSVYVREDALLGILGDFFAQRIFGADRSARVLADLGGDDERAEREREARMTALRRTLADLDARKARLIRRLEEDDDPEDVLYADVKARVGELARERATHAAELAALEEAAGPGEGRDASLLDRLPMLASTLDLAALPDATRRALFNAFRLVVHYDRVTNEAEVVVTLDGDTAEAVGRLGDLIPFPADRVPAGDGNPDGAPGTLLPMCDTPGGGRIAPLWQWFRWEMGRELEVTPMIRFITFERFVKGTVLILGGIALLALSGTDAFHNFVLRVQTELNLDPGQHLWKRLLDRLVVRFGTASEATQDLLGWGAILYGALEVFEGVGLLLRRRWAEYLVLLATAAFLPLEIDEVIRHPTVVKAVAFVVNVVIIAYLVWRKRLFLERPATATEASPA